MKFSRTAALLAAAALLVGSITGCARIVHIDAAPDANNPKCADVSVRLPDRVDAQSMNQTDAQATASWGQPSSVLLRCGIPPVMASTLRCVTVSGVDWLVDESKSPNYRFIAFGRTPATEVILNSRVVSGVSVLDAISDAVKFTVASRHCQ